MYTMCNLSKKKTRFSERRSIVVEFVVGIKFKVTNSLFPFTLLYIFLSFLLQTSCSVHLFVLGTEVLGRFELKLFSQCPVLLYKVSKIIFDI